MEDETRRPAPLGGFWALLGGGLLLAGVLIAEHPAVDRTGCSNYGGNGNGTPFADPVWDLYLPVLFFGWILLVVVEQAFPTTWRHRSTEAVVARIAAALLTVAGLSCFVVVPLEVMCH